MELLVIRHGIARTRTPDADETADAARPLTARGRRRFRRVVRGLGRLGVRIDHVLHSPKRRAVESAELLAPLLAHVDALHPSTNLAAEPMGELFGELARLGSGRVAVVGHEPYLGELIALLTTGSVQHGESLALRKGGVAWLEGTPAPGSMRLRAHLPPRVLRKLR